MAFSVLYFQVFQPLNTHKISKQTDRKDAVERNERQINYISFELHIAQYFKLTHNESWRMWMIYIGRFVAWIFLASNLCSDWIELTMGYGLWAAYRMRLCRSWTIHYSLFGNCKCTVWPVRISINSTWVDFIKNKTCVTYTYSNYAVILLFWWFFCYCKLIHYCHVNIIIQLIELFHRKNWSFSRSNERSRIQNEIKKKKQTFVWHQIDEMQLIRCLNLSVHICLIFCSVRLLLAKINSD